MTDAAERTLGTLIRTYGVELAYDRQRTRGLLHDLVRGDDLRVSLILVAQEMNTPVSLLAAATPHEASLIARRLQNDLIELRGLTAANAAWSVAAWAGALGVALSAPANTERHANEPVPPRRERHEPAPRSSGVERESKPRAGSDSPRRVSRREREARRRRRRNGVVFGLLGTAALLLLIALWPLGLIHRPREHAVGAIPPTAAALISTVAVTTAQSTIAATTAPADEHGSPGSAAVASPSAADPGACWTAAQRAQAGVTDAGTTIPRWTVAPAFVLVPGHRYLAIVTTDRGVFTIELDAVHASMSVNNFVCLARASFYDGMAFDRITSGAIQAGDSGGASGGPGYTVPGDPVTGDYERGAVAMLTASAGGVGSRFVLFLADYPGPRQYPIVGHVIDGLAVVDAVAADPEHPATIQRITIDEQSDG